VQHADVGNEALDQLVRHALEHRVRHAHVRRQLAVEDVRGRHLPDAGAGAETVHREMGLPEQPHLPRPWCIEVFLKALQARQEQLARQD
jgi:hypothetical protein